MNPYSPDGFWMKAKLFINRALESGDARSEDERRIWAAVSLEVLAKWALAETSPTLVVDPAADGGSQLIKALGLQEGSKNVTAQAKTIFSRCAQIFRPFDDRNALKIAGTRNDYLHGAGMEILTLPDDVWWPNYWSLVNILLISQQRALEDFVGTSQVLPVSKHLEKHVLYIEEQLEAAIGAALRNLRRFQEGTMTAQEKTRWDGFLRRIPNFFYSTQIECPACHALGEAQSDYAETKEIAWFSDLSNYEVHPGVEVTFQPDFFSCPSCHLILDDPQLIQQAGLDELITIESDEDPFLEGEYGND